MTVILTGMLLEDDHSLPMLLDYLHQCERTGVLTLHTPQGSAQLWHDGGQLIHAVFQGHAGVAAVATLMRVTARSPFTFQSRPADAPRSVTIPLGHLLMQAAQLLDENRAPELAVPAAPDVIISFEDVPALGVAGTGMVDTGVPGPQEERLLAAITGRRSVGDLARDLQLSVDELCAQLTPLLERGAVVLTPPLMHAQFWRETLRLVDAVAGKDGDAVLAQATRSVGAVPGMIPVAKSRAFLRALENGLGVVGSARRTSFSRSCYQLRQMTLNATGIKEEDWNSE
ncbi:DUF4388 domain-containing protein [Deinococcus sp.]|uniref:DUF4388 domain-containing protein n=1 Tax=Deinococcus sp. TaxID=47478 RepID=UPI002869A941|nr:DUF4388 domain-containing protein [Deinococcus sp.]